MIHRRKIRGKDSLAFNQIEYWIFVRLTFVLIFVGSIDRYQLHLLCDSTFCFFYSIRAKFDINLIRFPHMEKYCESVCVKKYNFSFIVVCLRFRSKTDIDVDKQGMKTLNDLKYTVEKLMCPVITFNNPWHIASSSSSFSFPSHPLHSTSFPDLKSIREAKIF